jgi:hypothetical protein
MKNKIWIFVCILLFTGLAACSHENREFTMHKAGEYKGAQDPLVAKDVHQELNNRFMQVQTDR